MINYTEAEMSAITLEDCIDLMEKKNTYAIINDGMIIEFIEE